MRTLALVALALGSLAAPAFADPPKVDNAFGFDWTKNPTKVRCAKLEKALLAKIQKGYACSAPEGGSASGKPALAACKAKKGTSEYLVFATLADCEAERDAQAANAD